MRLIRLFPVFLPYMISAMAVAQQKVSLSPWYIMPMANLLMGDHKTSGAVSITAGWHNEHWFLGGGGGVDFYKIRSVPLIGEVRYETSIRSRPFAYVQGGYNIACPLSYQHYLYNLAGPGASTRYRNGYYAGGGVGFYPLARWVKGFACTAGYSMKALTESYDEGVYSNGMIQQMERRRQYTLRRLAFSIAYRF